MTDIVERLRCHDDDRLYEEADLLMSSAADEIESLRQRVKELESIHAICPQCASKIDEAAGVDIAAKNRRIAELEDGGTRIITKLHERIAACEKERDTLKEQHHWRGMFECANEVSLQQLEQLTACQYYTQQLRKFVKTVADYLQGPVGDQARALTSIPHDTSALDALVKDAELWREHYKSLYEGLTACQHYAQQLRDILNEYVTGKKACGCNYDCICTGDKARAVLALPHDTSALDALVKDAARYKKIRAAQIEIIYEETGEKPTDEMFDAEFDEESATIDAAREAK